MVATSLADVVLMRAAERVRPRLLGTAEVEPAKEVTAPAAPEPTVTQTLVQMKDLLREMTLLFEEQNERLAALGGQRKETPAAA
ncbi:MAG: hypothetical protein K0S96_1852 [Geminicoccaceae bacterium]|jgi:hypothetical protein|nr:hypothetical protein [Geminicoccaceae bacterium]